MASIVSDSQAEAVDGRTFDTVSTLDEEKKIEAQRWLGKDLTVLMIVSACRNGV